MAAHSPLCEIRVVTFRRPAWLHHALSTLLAQDLTDWRAVILDDSPDREAQAVVADLDDPRLEYRPNHRSLGAAGNLNLAFTPRPLAGGRFACILEDDNWFEPTLLSGNVREIEAAGTSILLRNQRVWLRTQTSTVSTRETTRGRWFAPGVYSPLEVRSRMFFCEGLSNGGLFWNTATPTEFRVSESVRDAGLQELCRTLAVREPVAFASDPLAAFALMDEGLRTRSSTHHRTFGRGKQAIVRYLLRVHGPEIATLAAELAEQSGARAHLDAALSDALEVRTVLRRATGLRQDASAAKSLAKLLLVKDPVADFLTTLPALEEEAVMDLSMSGIAA